MKPRHLFSILGMALLIGCSPADPKSASADKPSHRAPDSAIIAKLQEIVEARQQLLKMNQLRVEVGDAENDGGAEIALAEARMQLARERGQADLVLAELRNIVRTHEWRVEMAKSRAAGGAGRTGEVETVRVALLEAQLRLQREQQQAQGK